jgi:hypothetical protein
MSFTAKYTYILNSEPPSKVLQSPGTYNKRENFVSALDIRYEQVLATVGKRTIVFIRRTETFKQSIVAFISSVTNELRTIFHRIGENVTPMVALID